MANDDYAGYMTVEPGASLSHVVLSSPMKQELDAVKQRAADMAHNTATTANAPYSMAHKARSK